ncbi:MAG: hypothetical protein KC502_08830 [Myxococcales bacterium]|nr:hypothetical protein [Myxococcales bacterium]
MSATLASIVQHDAEHIAKLVRKRAGDRAARKAARALLLRVFGALQDEEPDPDVDQLSSLVVETEAMRRTLEGPGWRVLHRIAEVWVRTPYREMFMRPSCANGAQEIADVRVDRFTPQLALSEARIAWMEQRCEASQPGLLRPVRAPKQGDGHRMTSGELELLRKRGRSKFS